MTVEEMYQHLEQTIREYNPSANFDQIHQAYEYAVAAHKGQNRKDGSPFVTHPITVAQIVAEELHLDSESIVAALLHDTIEDTDVTHEDIAKLFSPTIADLVEGVSKLTRVTFTSKAEEQMENLRKMLMAMAKDIRVILIKVSDRLHNMRTMEYQTPTKQKQKSLETMEIYAPIAHRLGMQRVKWELEDLSLKYLDPVGFKEIEDSLSAKSDEYNVFMDTIQNSINERLVQAGITATVYGRLKHPYSIYRKMYAQNKLIDDILDLIAFRVIVDTIPDCYNVLGIIHDLYRPVPGRFKDYIGTPKQNMYQSLHTTVMGLNAVPFEVQIRTYEMHEVAEYGIAAHWKYKQHGQGGGDEEKYEWVRRLLENQEGTDAEDYIHSLKIDIFADDVFVFTPTGDVINLPNGATPIDFAYNIHSAVGNHMVTAKVNGHIVQFDYHLHNGDVCEVITSKNAHGPSRDWINIAKSNNARSKIRQWFKHEKRDENIINGRASFESEVKHLGISLKELITEDNIPNILRKTSFNCLDDLYAAIGYGGTSSAKVIGKLREEIQKITSSHKTDRAKDEPANAETTDTIKPVVPVHHTKAQQGVIVEGVENCLVKFAKCCTPVPGDQIIGFITKGYGVSVHRHDCPNVLRDQKNPAYEGRWLKVEWAAKTNEIYHTSLQITAKDRSNLLLDVSTALSSTKTWVYSINMRSTADGFSICDAEIGISNNEQLSTVIRRIAQVSGVLKVGRPTG